MRVMIEQGEPLILHLACQDDEDRRVADRLIEKHGDYLFGFGRTMKFETQEISTSHVRVAITERPHEKAKD